MTIMRFSPSDIPKMAIAAVGTAVIFIIFLNLPQPTAPPKGKDVRISWDSALKLQSQYLENKPLLVDYLDDASGQMKRDELQGFRFPAAAIDEVINHNKFKGGAKAEEIIIYLGIDGYSKMPNDPIPNYTLFIAGILNNEIMRNADSSNNIESSVMDRADPCPPNCPK